MTQEEAKLNKWYTASRDRVFKAVFVNGMATEEIISKALKVVK